MFKPGTPEDRALGAFIGLAVGDALGAAVEFYSKGEYEPLTGYRDGGPFNLIGGQWTDDTSQAICIAEWLLEERVPRIDNLRDRFCEWLFTGKNSSTGVAFDIGNGTRRVLEEHRAGQVKPETLENSGGNGAIMRLAPVAIKARNNLQHALFWASISGQATHGHQSSIDCVKLLTTILVVAIRKEAFLPQVLSGLVLGNLLLEDSELRSKFLKVTTQYDCPEIINIDGYSITTLLAATQSFLKTSTFKDCVLDAVNKGGDTDSVGAVAGQIAGAHYGYSQIPKQFLTKLWNHDRLMQLATALIN